ncbi:MAG: glycosyltransferase family 2 protein [Actinobacteria bacterium]|nr:glycosyltransferase family 2 protein [Actinomycetota bacterium]
MLKNNNTDLSVAIVNYNGLNIIERCITSIAKYLKEADKGDLFDFEIIIADNASTDGSAEKIISMSLSNPEFNLKIIKLEKNLGFASASNIAAKKAKGTYILFLNPDTQFIQKGLKKLIDFYGQKFAEAKIGAVGAKLLNEDMSLQYSCRSFLTLARQFYESFFLSKIFKHSKIFGSYFMTYAGHDNVMEVDWLSGAFMLFKRQIFINTGGFDTGYFMYSEDADICLRLKRAGYVNYYYPYFGVLHADAGIASSNPSLRNMQIMQSRKLYFKKNHSAAHAAAFGILYFFHIINRIILYFILFILKGRKKGSKYSKLFKEYLETFKLCFSKKRRQ